MKEKKPRSTKKIIRNVIIGALAFAVVEVVVLGVFGIGPLSKLSDVRMGMVKGNSKEYSFSNLTQMENSPFEGQNICILGSSVAYGANSLQEAVGEYFAQRFGCGLTKETVSGTTLVDNNAQSYVSRMKSNIDQSEEFALFICQLSTNDATKNMPLGEIVNSESLDDFDTSTITGALSYIICYTKQTWDCPVAFFTGSYYESEAYAAMVNRLYELQEVYDFAILDLYTDEGFNNIPDEQYKLYMMDKIHPTKAGYRDWWCPELEQQLLTWLEE